jgi:sensor histidine kinase YesM
MNASVQGSPSGPKAKRHIRNFLIDKNFQMGWVLRVTLVTTVIVGIMGYFLYGTLAESTELVKITAMSQEGMSPAAQEAFIKQGDSDKARTLLILGGGLVGLVLLLGLMTIVATHKIAGPAYKIRRLLSSIDGDHLQLWAKLRKGDELHEVFQEFDDMVQRLREARHQDVKELESIRAELEGHEASAETRKRLDKLLDGYRNSVKMS